MGKIKKKLLITLVSLLVLSGIYAVLCFVKSDPVIWENTSVNNVSIGGMTVDEAKAAVEDAFKKENEDAAFTVRVGGSEYSIPVFKSVSFDASPAIQAAYNIGHREWYFRGFDFITSTLSKNNEIKRTAAASFADEKALDAAIDESGIKDFKNLTETTWEIDGDELVIHKGNNGDVPDTDALKEVIKENISGGALRGEIDCPVKTQAMKEVNFDEVSRSIRTISTEAYMNSDHKVVEAKTGYALNPHVAEAIYEQTLPGSDAFVPIEVTEPEVSTEEYEELLFRDKLTGYKSQYYSIWGRNDNLKTATESVNGTILMPGEVFSYGKTLGDITYERGYRMGDAYLNGDVTSTLGGGVCQVASTIFASVLYTDFEIVERRCHSMVVSYLPLGMDATFFNPSTDFKFRNTSDYPIRIDAVSDGGTVYIEIYGTADPNKPDVEAVVFRSGLHAETYRYYYDPADTEHTNPIEKEYIGPSSYKTHP